MVSKYNNVLVFIIILYCVCGQHPTCNIMKTVVLSSVNRTISIYSPSYPRYAKNINCRWIIGAPEGYVCKVHCDEFFSIRVRDQDQCAVDYLLISRSGDTRFESADLYCGHGAISTLSFGRNITIGLVAKFKARLNCNITPVPAVDPNCTCGLKTLQNRTVEGVETQEYEYPSVAGLVDLAAKKIFCGGAIIDSRHVLTSAHCVVGMKPKYIGVLTGERALNESSEEFYKISEIIIHPMYTAHNYDFDAALLRMRDEIQFGVNVGPVCLPFKFVNTKDVNMPRAKVTVLGWGAASSGGSKPSVLLKTTLTITSWERCLRANPKITTRHICTYKRGKDGCLGDPGGPLLYSDPDGGRVFTLGIVSHGKSCATAPTVNTMVAKILHWITRATKVDYCRK